jgi:amidase
VRVVGLVTSVAGTSMPPSFADAVRRAGVALEEAGWKAEEIEAPEIERIGEVWAGLLAFGLRAAAPLMTSIMTPGAAGVIHQLLALPSMDADALFVERHRLRREWSAFLADHPIVVGPTWCDVQFEHDADIDPETGVVTTLARLPFILPGNLLGLPSCAVPTGVSAGLPTGVQVCADLWRDDRCLDAAEVIETALGTITPIDPR